MIDRQVVLPVSPTELWRSLTDPDEVATWFGGRVQWELTPGGLLQVTPDAGEDDVPRSGIIDEVEPERWLRFQWWPTDAPADRSEVSYEIEPHDDGSLLRIAEWLVPVTVDAIARTIIGQPVTALGQSVTALGQSVTASPAATTALALGSWDIKLFALDAAARHHTLERR